ncbi:hypothetical protein [Kordiimonas sp.]|uniref:hypothetical protein n=1 Tax=Kordiimonas sp. TaxID=1970157 RepID=UPI003A8D0231
MPTEHAISALLQTRKEIAGQIEALEAKVATLQADLIHVDATLRIMGYDGPGLTMGAKRASTAGLFHRNELKRYVQDYFRKHPEGFTCRQLCLDICLQRGWDSTQKPFMDSLINKVGHFLNRYARKYGWQCERGSNDYVWRKV